MFIAHYICHSVIFYDAIENELSAELSAKLTFFLVVFLHACVLQPSEVKPSGFGDPEGVSVYHD